jgi:hypothetical protein
MVLIVAIALVAYKCHLDLDRYGYGVRVVVVALIFLGARLSQLLPVWFGHKSRNNERPTYPL